MSIEPVFWNPVDTAFDCAGLTIEIDIRSYASVELLGICPDKFSSDTSMMIARRRPGLPFVRNTVHMDDRAWRRGLAIF